MTPPRSIVGTLAALRIFRSFRWRALIFGGLVAILGLLAFFPERYLASVTLTPADPQSLGLSGTVGQLGAFNSVFGNQAAVEVALRVGKSVGVRDIVIQRLNLQKRLHFSNRVALHRWLEQKVEIRSLRGGIIVVEMQDRDADLSREIVGAFADASQARLAQISLQQTAYKRNVLLQLVDDASRRLAAAQLTYDNFRLHNQAPSPYTAVEAVSQRIPQLQAAIKLKQVELSSARELLAEENPVVRQRRAELATLQQQLAQVQTTSPSQEATVGRAVETSSQLFKLERDLNIARALYDSYLRFLQGTTVEELTSTAYVRILEPAHVETARQIWWPLFAGALGCLLAWMAVEFYRLRPPVGSRLNLREAHDQQA